MSATALLLLILPVAQPAATDPAPPQSFERPIALAKAFVQQVTQAEFDKAVEPFDATMKAGLSAATVKMIWDGLTNQYGEFQRAEKIRTEEAGKYRIVFVTTEFTRGILDTKVVFDTDNRIAGLFFLPAGKYEPPAYAKPADFTEIEIQVGKGFFPLTGTLSIPNGDGPFPAIVLVHGSGPNDRDETIGPNKPFRDLAHGLASRGIAVLRYEKRTKQYALVMALNTGITVKEETISDAAAAVETLAAREKIDPKRIFILGHSLGGMLLPRIAAATDKPAGFISLAGSTRPMEDLILEQTKYILSLDGKETAAEKEQLEIIEKQVALVKSSELTPQTPASDLPLSVPAKYWLDLRDYDSAEEAKKIKQPMLILQGERDYQVTMVDFARWREALGSRPDVKFISYPRLNHLFQDGDGKSFPVEYFRPGNVAEQVVADIAQWILATGGK